MDAKTYQVCATCIHFKTVRLKSKLTYLCGRLNFETKPDYSFQCWDPQKHVIKLMKKRGVLNE